MPPICGLALYKERGASIRDRLFLLYIVYIAAHFLCYKVIGHFWVLTPLWIIHIYFFLKIQFPAFYTSLNPTFFFISRKHQINPIFHQKLAFQTKISIFQPFHLPYMQFICQYVSPPRSVRLRHAASASTMPVCAPRKPHANVNIKL